MSEQNGDRRDAGFEYAGAFYRWHLSDVGKDLMLIDRFSGLPVQDFFELVEDDVDRGRAPIMLTLIATSIRHGHPEWTVERIVRLVQNLSLSDVEFIDGDEEEAGPGPPAEAPASTGDGSSTGSKPTSSVPTPAIYETSSVTPG